MSVRLWKRFSLTLNNVVTQRCESYRFASIKSIAMTIEYMS